MKKMYTPQGLAFSICCLFLILSFSTFAQVGIGTTNPNSNAKLDITSTVAEPGGLLLPRLALTGTANTTPLAAHVAGMTVYNTATAGDVTPGYYYNDGSQWVRIAAASVPSNDWTLTGNAGTTAGTNFLGTTDDVAIRFKTFNADRFEISTGNAASRGRLRAFENGDAAAPIYSWNANVGTGMFQQAANVIGFSTNGTERFRIPNANQVHANSNGTAALPFYSWASDTDLGMYRISANTLGFSALQASLNGSPLYVGDRFTVNGAADEFAINGYTSGVNGVSVYGENTTNGGTGIWGTAPAGTGVYGTNTSGAGDGVFGNSTNVGVRGYGAHGAIMESGLDGGYGVIAWNTTGSGSNRTALMAAGQNLGLLSFPTTGAILYGTGSGGVGFANDASGTGILGVGNAGTTAYSLTAGSGIAGTGNVTGVYGISTATSGIRQGGYFTMNKSGAVSPPAADDPVAILAGYNGTDYFGGYFDGNQDNNAGGAGGNAGEDYAYVGARISGTTYKIVGTGSNSTMVNDATGNKRVLFSPEAPEILFEDYGTAKLINGVAEVRLDPLLSSIIHVSENNPLKVFIQLEGECNGVFVTDKSVNGFKVKELANGRSNVSFSWHIVANRADTKLADGTVFSKHVGVRFPMGPNKINPSQILSNAAQSNTSYSDQQVNNNGEIKNSQKFASQRNQTKDPAANSEVKPSASEVKN